MPAASVSTNVADVGGDMRSRIEALAQELLVKYGVRGCTFNEIAEELGITRANVHYHFGNKSDLVDEVIARYITDMTERFRLVWVAADRSISDKIEGTIALNRARYATYNQNGGGQGWSLITRMRGEEDALSAQSVRTVRQFTKDLAEAVQLGLQQAIARGELVADAPLQDIGIQLVNIINCAGLTTMDALDFARLEEVYRSFQRMLLAAYGRPPAARRASARSGLA